MDSTLYHRLIGAPGGGDPFDRHVFACVLTLAAAEPHPGSLERGLGLSAEALAALIGRHFPAAPGLLAGLSAGGDGHRPLSPEEPDLRAMLLDYRRGALIEEEWLAHILARRSLASNHLWQDLGLPGRTDLSALINRHFPALATLNRADMKWKKFLYRELCRRDGLTLCKSPNCEVCADHAICFGTEAGRALFQAG